MCFRVGASSCIVRAKQISVSSATVQLQTAQTLQAGSHDSRCFISPLALQEAGCMSVCRSVAWTNKVVTSAWLVFAVRSCSHNSETGIGGCMPPK
jgi:hypothetical protein